MQHCYRENTQIPEIPKLTEAPIVCLPKLILISQI